MRLLLAAISLCILQAQNLETLRTLPTVQLEGETYHVQGIDVDDSTLWLSSVDAKTKRGFLSRYDRKTGVLQLSVDVQQEKRFHPGGIMLSGNRIWIPIAEYRRNSSATIQLRDPRTLILQHEFLVQDHIGAVAVVPEGLLGANWDARDFYLWNIAGQLIRKFPNPTGLAVQDMKFTEGMLIAGGLLPDKTGAIMWFEWPSMKTLRTLQTGRTDRGVVFTNEGLAIRGNTLFLLPEDSNSRLFSFELPRDW